MSDDFADFCDAVRDVAFRAAAKHYGMIDPGSASSANEVYGAIIAQAIKDTDVSRAVGAAKRNEAEDEPRKRTPAQLAIKAAVVRFFLENGLAKSFPQMRAEAFGREIADGVTHGDEYRADTAAKEGRALRAPTAAEQAIEREREIERNRRKPPRKALYSI